MKTESVTYIKGERERFEFQDMVLLKQRDQKRIDSDQQDRQHLPRCPRWDAVCAPRCRAPCRRRPNRRASVMVATTIVDTGERKSAFGQQARHVKTMIDRQPMAGACDTSKQRIETDGWYIDAPAASPIRPPRWRISAAAPGRLRRSNPGDEQRRSRRCSASRSPTRRPITGDDGKPVDRVDGGHRVRTDDARRRALRDSGRAERGDERARALEGAERRERGEAGRRRLRRRPPRRRPRRPAWCESACPSSPTRRRRPWTRARCASA